MSEEIVLSSFREAVEENFVPMFVVSPRQVDGGRGYTGWSQESLVEFIRSAAEMVGYKGSWLIARDHGGPYQGVRDRGRCGVGLDEAMGYAREMFARDLRSGFNIIHVDATEDPSGTLEVGEIARRTAELIAYIEDIRLRERLPEVYYEVGSEEVSGGITEPKRFEDFILLLKGKLAGFGCEQAINRLLFVVGQAGTTMRIDMANNFAPEQAKALADVAFRHNLFLKVHYTDWLETSTLEQFPKLGVGAANVGPEFATAIIEALEELERIESRILQKGNGTPSRMMEALEEATIEKSPWRRFAPKKLSERKLEEYAQANRRRIALCMGRYVMKDPKVVEARQRLYENIRRCGQIGDPHQYIIDRVQKAIHRYVIAFGLAKTLPAQR
jgi:tagatose-1,6-bisphosphate aldolase non-catalytic subunit AgaZ/GatZ